MQQKGWLVFTLFAALLTPLFAVSPDPDILRKISQRPYWQILLHIKDGRSEIDDPSFFLTPPERFSPLSELNATLMQLKDADQRFLCRYPARIHWLKTQLPDFFGDLPDTTCHELEQRLAKKHIRAVTLVFPTTYINSPASMFGHTFLRLDSDARTPMLGEAVNYAARTDEQNGLRYLYNGLLGGYRGYYSVLPYYQKIKEYSAMEQRDMWEYRLDLSQEEIDRMLYHLYELKGIYGDYYFFTKNCSYNLLWLLQSAKATRKYTDAFHYKAIPIDTIRVVDADGLISDVTYRPSERRKMQALAARTEDIALTKRFIDSGGDTALIRTRTPLQQALMCELAIRDLKHARSQKRIDSGDYIRRLRHLLHYRSKLPKLPKYPIPTPTDPRSGHKSAKIALGIGSGKKIDLTLKPAMHAIDDLDRGFVRGAYIDFFALRIRRSQFDSFSFVSVTSLAERGIFFKPWSWRAQIAVERLRPHHDYFTLTGGAGQTFRYRKATLYALAVPKLWLARHSRASVGYDAGLLLEGAHAKAGLIMRADYLDNGTTKRREEAFVTFGLHDDLALNLKLQEDKISQKSMRYGAVALFYYF